MSNRTSAFLLLLAICAGLLGFVYYYFIANVGNLLIDVGEAENVSISIRGEFQNSYEENCNRKCTFRSIPPINYSITAAKDGYKEYISEFKVERGQTKIVRVPMKKKVELVAAVKSNDQKIMELRYKKYLESLSDEEKIYQRSVVGIYKDKLVSYSANKGFRIYSYDGNGEFLEFFQDDVNATSIGYNGIDGIINYMVERGSFIYDVDKKTNYKLNIDETITFVKRSSDESKYIIMTDQGVYLYSAENNNHIKNTLFDDFVMLGNSKVIGLIKKDSSTKLSILNFKSDGKNKLILHDLKTRERKIIHEIEGGVKNIMLNGNEINYTDSDDKIYSLKELEIE